MYIDCFAAICHRQQRPLRAVWLSWPTPLCCLLHVPCRYERVRHVLGCRTAVVNATIRTDVKHGSIRVPHGHLGLCINSLCSSASSSRRIFMACTLYSVGCWSLPSWLLSRRGFEQTCNTA